MSGCLVSRSSVAWLWSEWKHGEETLSASYASPWWWEGGGGVYVSLTSSSSPTLLDNHPHSAPPKPSPVVKAVACQSFFRVTFPPGDDWPPGEAACSTPQTTSTLLLPLTLGHDLHKRQAAPFFFHVYRLIN